MCDGLRIGRRGQRIAGRQRHFAQTADFGRGRLAARYVQQILQQFLNAARCAIDIAGQALHVRGRQVGIHQHLGAAIDRRQRIAQIVHDRAGEAPDGRDALLPDQILARLPDGGAHIVERARQAAHLVFAGHLHLDGVVLARHFGRGAVQLLHRLDDPARQQVREAQPDRNRQRPEQDDVRIEAGDALPGALRTIAESQISANWLAGDVQQRSYQAGILQNAIADAIGAAASCADGARPRFGGARIQGG